MVARGARIVGSIREHSNLAFSVGLGVLIGAVYFDPLFLHRAFVGRDLVAFFYPIEKAIHDGWRSGNIPLLLPEVSFGRPLAANPNSGAFYPLRIAMALLPFAAAIKAFIVLHVWLAGIGAQRLARFLGASLAGSAVAGIVFSLCGPTTSDTAYPNILPGLAAMPFVILSAGVLARAPSRRGAALFATVWGVALLIGDVFTAGLAFVGAALLSIEEARMGGRGRALGRLLAASLPGFLVSSIQAVPALLLVPHTVRALGRFPIGAALTWSVSLWRFLELVARFPFGNIARSAPAWGHSLFSGKAVGFFTTLYVGVFSALSVVAARPPRKRRLFLYAFAGLSVLSAVAGFYCPARLLESASPIPLRYPEKLMVGFTLVSALMSSIFTDRLLSGRPSRSWVAPFSVAVLAGAAAAILALSPHAAARFIRLHWTQFSSAAETGAQRLPGILFRGAIVWLLAAIAVFVASRMRSRIGAAVLLAAFVAADLSATRFSSVRTDAEVRVFAPPASAELVRRIDQGELFGYLPVEDYYLRSFDRDALPMNSAAMFGVFYVFNEDYDAADLYRVDVARQQIYRDSGRWTGLPRYLAAFSARSAIVETGRMPAGFSVPGPIVGTRWVVVNPSAVPLIRFAPAIEEVENAGAAYAAIRDERRDLVSTPVVETGGRGKTTLSSGTFRVLRWEPSDLAIETQTPGAARLIMPRAFYPYRTFRIDGVRAEAEATNFCLSSVAVPAGTHIVRVTEELPGGAAGPVLSIAGILSVLLMAKKGVGNAKL